MLKKIMLILMILFLYTVLVNFAGRYMGIKEEMDFIDGRCSTVLKASDVCLKNDMIFFVDGNKNVSGCVSEIEPKPGMWYTPND